MNQFKEMHVKVKLIDFGFGWIILLKIYIYRYRYLNTISFICGIVGFFIIKKN